MSRFKINRRQLLGAAATTAVAGLVLARETSLLGDGGHDATNNAGAETGAEAKPAATAAPPTTAAAPTAATVPTAAAAWLDGMLSGDDLTQAHASLAPMQPKILEHDLLWQWRRDLAQELRNGVRAIAITRWDKAILLKGLARETGLPVRQTRIGHSLFQTEIG